MNIINNIQLYFTLLFTHIILIFVSVENDSLYQSNDRIQGGFNIENYAFKEHKKTQSRKLKLNSKQIYNHRGNLPKNSLNIL